MKIFWWWLLWIKLKTKENISFVFIWAFNWNIIDSMCEQILCTDQWIFTKWTLKCQQCTSWGTEHCQHPKASFMPLTSYYPQLPRLNITNNITLTSTTMKQFYLFLKFTWIESFCPYYFICGVPFTQHYLYDIHPILHVFVFYPYLLLYSI